MNVDSNALAKWRRSNEDGQYFVFINVLANRCELTIDYLIQGQSGQDNDVEFRGDRIAGGPVFRIIGHGE